MEEVFLVGELIVVFEVVERMLEDAIVDAVLVLVGLVGLLPAQVDEELLPVAGLGPLAAGGEHATHQLPVVPQPDEEAAALVGTGGYLALGDCVGTTRRGTAVEVGALGQREVPCAWDVINFIIWPSSPFIQVPEKEENRRIREIRLFMRSELRTWKEIILFL